MDPRYRPDGRRCRRSWSDLVPVRANRHRTAGPAAGPDAGSPCGTRRLKSVRDKRAKSHYDPPYSGLGCTRSANVPGDVAEGGLTDGRHARGGGAATEHPPFPTRPPTPDAPAARQAAPVRPDPDRGHRCWSRSAVVGLLSTPSTTRLRREHWWLRRWARRPSTDRPSSTSPWPSTRIRTPPEWSTGQPIHPSGNPGWPAYGPTNQFQVPAHALVTVTVRQYDSGGASTTRSLPPCGERWATWPRSTARWSTPSTPTTWATPSRCGVFPGTDPGFFLSVPFPAVPGNNQADNGQYESVVVQFRVRDQGDLRVELRVPLRDSDRRLRRSDVRLRIHVGVHPCRLRNTMEDRSRSATGVEAVLLRGPGERSSSSGWP